MNTRYIYGLHPVLEQLRGQPAEVDELLIADATSTRLAPLTRLAEAAGIAISIASRHRLHDLVPHVPHQGVVARVKEFGYAALETLVAAAGRMPPLLVALDQVQDPHNLGALIRSAQALGAHGLFFSKDRACEVTPTVVKAAAGATTHLPIARVTNLRRALTSLKEQGLWIVGTTPSAHQSLSQCDLRGPTVLVIGSEGNGMRRMTHDTCDHLARIPLFGDVASLNAAAAGAICLYEAARQRTVSAGDLS